jgi:hypothetical protein
MKWEMYLKFLFQQFKGMDRYGDSAVDEVISLNE